MPLIIAQCSGSKAKGTSAAFSKYQTRNHAAIREFMLDNNAYQAGWDWSILSAEYGLVHPTASISDYDTVLMPYTVDAFVAKHSKAIAAEVASNESADAILFIGSKLYFDALCRALPNRRIKHIGNDYGRKARGCGDYFSALLEGFAMYDEAA